MILPSPPIVILVGFAGLALATLQNVTVDDAVLTGAVVPQYLPSDSVWNIGNNCTTCAVRPDPALAYNGTWHDTTYRPLNDNYTPSIDFTFTGSALYIFFIIANNLPEIPTYTNVTFVLDQVPVSTYLHTPSTSADYQYNVPVFSNDSLALSQHNMLIQPTSSGNGVLILFDYLIYTVDTSSSASSSASATIALLPSATSTLPSPTPSGTGTSSGQNVSAIVGGTVGGIVALVLVGASIFCYHRHTKRSDGQPSPVREGGTVVDVLSREVPSTPLDRVSSTHRSAPIQFSITEPMARSDAGVSPAPVRPSDLASSNPAFSSSGSTSPAHNFALREQVEQLRGEVTRLRHLQDTNRNTLELLTEAPPEYS